MVVAEPAEPPNAVRPSLAFCKTCCSANDFLYKVGFNKLPDESTAAGSMDVMSTPFGSFMVVAI